MSMDAKMPRVAAARQPRSGSAWRVLAIDTCFARCAVALAERKAGEISIAASLSRDMMRGHAAFLTPMVEQALQRMEWRPSELDLVAVTIGPGSFTGVRIGVAMARGLSMTLRCPVAGILTTEALRLGATQRDLHQSNSTVVVAVESGRGDYFVALGDSAPIHGTVGEVAARLSDRHAILIGDGARRLAGELRLLGVQARMGTSSSSVDPAVLATHALTAGVEHWAAANARDGLPQPVYLRGADVTLPGGARGSADLGC